MTKSELIKGYNLTEGQFYGTETISGDLNLSSLKSIPEGFNPTVGGGLDLDSLTSIPEGFNPTVGGYLNLHSLISIPEGFNPTVGGSLDLHSLTSIPEGFNPTVGVSLNLRSLKSIPEGFNPTVGGNLHLSSLKSIPEGFNPTVGGNLYLYSLKSIPEGFNPTVGGSLYLYDGMSCDKTPLGSTPLTWQNGKYMSFDGIFGELISRKGNVWKCKKVNKEEIFYVITDGEGRYSHGASLQEAREDLAYKIADNIDKEKYKGLPLDTKFTFSEAVQCYRLITGACSFGTRHFIESYNISKRKKYTIKDMITLTEGQYGHNTFKEWFN
jgi:hypothetical protein